MKRPIPGRFIFLKKALLSTMYTINAEAKVIAQDLKIDERIEQYGQK